MLRGKPSKQYRPDQTTYKDASKRFRTSTLLCSSLHGPAFQGVQVKPA